MHKRYEFTIVVRGDCTHPDIADRLLGVFDDDPGISTSGDLSYIDLTVEAGSYGMALARALQQFFEAGIGMPPVDILVDWLMTLEQMAEFLPFGYERLRQLQSGAQGPGDFPRPALTNGRRVKVWNWGDVKSWLVSNDLVAPEAVTGEPEADQSVATIRAALRLGDKQILASLEPDVRDFVTLYASDDPH